MVVQVVSFSELDRFLTSMIIAKYLSVLVTFLSHLALTECSRLEY